MMSLASWGGGGLVAACMLVTSAVVCGAIKQPLSARWERQDDHVQVTLLRVEIQKARCWARGRRSEQLSRMGVSQIQRHAHTTHNVHEGSCGKS
jgi:O-glycosyl hydrolase